MTDPKSVETIYSRVIEDTINKLAPEFENAGVSLQALSRLREVWMSAMLNMMRAPVLETQSSYSGGQGYGMGSTRGGVPISGVKGGVGGVGRVKGAEEGKGGYGALSTPLQPSSHSTSGITSSSGMHVDDPLRYTKEEKVVMMSGASFLPPKASSHPSEKLEHSSLLKKAESNGNGMMVEEEEEEEEGLQMMAVVGKEESIVVQIHHPSSKPLSSQQGNLLKEEGESSGQSMPLHHHRHHDHDNENGIVGNGFSTEGGAQLISSTQDDHNGPSSVDPSSVNPSSHVVNNASSSIAPLPSLDPSSSSTAVPTAPSSTTPSAPVIDSDSDESSEVSDEEEIDTSSWTNSLMSLYEEPTKRTKNKRTYKLVRGILNVDGRDYLFKSGKAEFDWK